MQKSENTILKRIESISYDSIRKVSFALLMFWIVTPLIVMLLNICGLDGPTIYAVWICVVDVVGGAGLAIGLAYFVRLIKNSPIQTKKIIVSFTPIILLICFLLWSLISCLLAEDKVLAFYGRMPMYDCWSVYLLYGGFIFLGLIISESKSKVVILAKTITCVALIQAIVAISDSNLTEKLCVIHPFTNCYHYQSVFYNTNHYAYYILITTLVVSFLYIYSKFLIKKICYALVFSSFVFLLVLNNTLGSYLALLVTLLFMLAWNFMNKENNKADALILFILFVIVSGLATLVTDNSIDSLSSMFADIESLSIDKNVDSLGSGRGKLWKNAIVSIMQHPIFGIGFENLGNVSMGNGFNHPHNVLLQLAMFTGIPGAMFYISAYFVGAIRLLKQRKIIGNICESAGFIVVGYMMSAFFGVPKFYTSPYFLTILGVCMSDCLNGINKNGGDF